MVDAVPTIRCCRPVTKSVLSPKNKGFCNPVIGGVKPGCLQSGLLAQDESFARLGRAVANDVGERIYDSKRRSTSKRKLHLRRSFRARIFVAKWPLRLRDSGPIAATRGEKPSAGCPYNDLHVKRN
jgi:hypothetical protein